jgi:hypothetical protein
MDARLVNESISILKAIKWYNEIDTYLVLSILLSCTLAEARRLWMYYNLKEHVIKQKQA